MTPFPPVSGAGMAIGEAPLLLIGLGPCSSPPSSWCNGSHAVSGRRTPPESDETRGRGCS